MSDPDQPTLYELTRDEWLAGGWVDCPDCEHGWMAVWTQQRHPDPSIWHGVAACPECGCVVHEYDVIDPDDNPLATENTNE